MTTAPAAYAVQTPAGPAHVQYLPAPGGGPADAPRVFAVINAVMRGTTPVAKEKRNEQQRFMFRGIDDLMSAVAGPMREHGLFILPEVAEQTAERRGEGGKMTTVRLTMRYYLYGPAGDALLATVPGEASDHADKATNKAMSAAMKYLLLQVLMIPVDARSIDDGDRDTPALPDEQAPPQQQNQPRRSQRAEPGPWEQPRPSRDFVAEAQAAADVATVRKLHAAAKNEGAPADYLATLVEIGSGKPGAKPRPQISDDDLAAAAASGHPDVERAAHAEADRQEHAAALGEMYDAAKTAGLSGPAEADEAFVARFQCQPVGAPVAQLREMRDDLLDAAEGGAA
ncbi:ERF family protein [Streptomyces iconiensis]|uniref:ERF family protein n=1 Tax=Streptomyces iconiensis TaxID=1384038 RepID=A0ABT6ZRR2_9ACTN|nr:ERF family protein [Streptomyces iconiensis]MDJ1131751.1 ERF family protein [Streptomyces iconiensis]